MIRVHDAVYLWRYYKENGWSFLRGIGVRKRNPGTPSFKRVLEARDRGHVIRDARFVVNADRLDIAAKTLFARAYVEGVSSRWPEAVYKEHLRSWNNFYEDEPNKETYEDFKNSYIGIIDSYLCGRMNYADSPVVVNQANGMLRNGGHRVAAAIVTGNLVNVIEEKQEKERSWGADFFRGKLSEKPEFLLGEKYLDAMTREYVSLCPEKLFAVIIFPAAKGHRREADQHLKRIGKVVNQKVFKHNELDGESVVRQLYYGEEWNYEGSRGVSNKAEWCFSGKGNLHVYIIESNMSMQERVREKEYLRNVWGVDKNSIHMTDTYDEVNIVARMFFHEGTVETLRRYYSFSPSILNLFDQYKKALPKGFIDKDRFCIDSSAVMDFFGLRNAADVDYISICEELSSRINGVERHDGKYTGYYPLSVEEMITDPNNFFYYAGCKILKLDLVESMKRTRVTKDPDSASKDLKDIELIENYKKNPKTIPQTTQK